MAYQNHERVHIMGRRGGKLGSLTQSARSKEIKNARNIMFLVAVLLGLGLIIEWVTAENQLKQAGVLVDRAQFNKLMIVVTVVYVSLIAMYVTFGFLLLRYPAPITITGLVVYIAIYLIFGAMNPEYLYKGLVIKILIVVGLAKAIQAAIAFEKERKSSRRRRRSLDEDDEDDRRRRRRDEEDDDELRSRRRRDEEDEDDVPRRRRRRTEEDEDDDDRGNSRRRNEDDNGDRGATRRRRSSYDEDRDR